MGEKKRGRGVSKGVSPEKGGRKSLLELTGVEVRYDASAVVSDLSMSVEEGSVVALLGANGAGKSSVLKRISGLIRGRRDEGTILFDGRPIDSMRPEHIVRAGISCVPEGRELFGDLTVSENLKMGSYIRRERAGIKEDLERVNGYFPVLKDRKKQITSTLSGGEQQMLAVARGLMSRPRLLMLDEPSLGLAPMLVKDIFGIIREINREGVTVLIVEQNARMALEVADFGYVMETGRIVLEGTAENLRGNNMVREYYLGGRKK
ncbi:MAG: ABC transporter ATP-binding protein [Deltaproteobacteria bacterium]|uniref:ABC transporter ATP-binding protein n=1 Tax=Candidatus Zymogenus saltonus TaxID=2844893 RepID=A0A9D8PRH2_9DELT|nr:ABC transporter ATP-binding protein [Candidatus Zymogenus saltonus]